MSDPAATLASLLRSSTIQDHDEVLKAANAAIKASKGNLRAQHTRVVALLKLDRFDDALRALAEGGDSLEKECQLEKTYALYKSGQLEDAQKAVASAPGSKSQRAFRHVAAQISYRAENFQDAAATYRNLLNEGGGLAGEENDLKINLLAANAQLEWNGLGHVVDVQERQPSRQDLEAFETAYNAACAYIARGDFTRASVLLKRARDLCEASEDLSADEKKAELLPIMVQHAYVLSRSGKNTEAAALQKSIVLSEIPEAPTRAVAQNNQVAIGAGERNPYLTKRLTESATALPDSQKLFEYQASVLRRNRYALELQAQKFQGVESSTRSQILGATIPTASVDVANLGVISAAAHTRLGTGKVALKQILPMLERRPNDVGLLLTIIQLYVQMQSPGPALALLETFLQRLETATAPDHEDVRFAPGLVAAAVALYRLQGRQNSIRMELARASAHWRSRSEPSSTSLLREAGVELLRSSNPEDLAAAGATFEKLVAQSENDMTAIAGLVASFATSDYAKVEPYLQGLTTVERLAAGANVQALIDAGVAAIPVPVPMSKKRAADGDPEKDKAVKRRRKKRLPKNYEEGKQPDPERWLPLRDRSTYRPKGKKGKKRAQEATQGGMVKQEETLELVGGAGAVKVEKATGGQGGKKKKKGKK
ncbi:Uu.00g091700.m01.CDS01 [Anthostomella pinea]|uniref:Signal recognition particle subunit SRP72 n=1 Tax=Anthostomella pinea TaxID=933095 RepID=A0AAI8VN61_9PEZI|nr:Uu.00g091700.m01.CDS01 [Anthostomella pinea]